MMPPSRTKTAAALWIEAVGPAPARNQISFVALKGGGQVLNVLLRRGAGAGKKDVRSDPGKVERSERAEQVAAVDGAQTVGEDEVVDDAGPEFVVHAEPGGRHQRQVFQAEQRLRREHQRPDLLQVAVGDAEGFEHGSDRSEE